MARKPSRRSALSSNPDSIFESRAHVDRQVAQKLNKAKKAWDPKILENLTAKMRFKDIELARAAAKKGHEVKYSRLNERQQAYVTNYVVKGMPKMEAARAAGYSAKHKHTVRDMEKNPRVQEAIAKEQELFARAKGVTREHVIEGMLEAIDMARMKADPLSMIAGWREIGKVCGHYEPVKHKIEVSVEGQVMMQQITAMSDKDLLELAAKASLPAPIEGVFTALPPASTSALHPAAQEEDD